MWFSNRKKQGVGGAAQGAPSMPAGSSVVSGGARHEPRCASCASELAHCHGTLVLHADGDEVCDEASSCHNDTALHQWWVPCTELHPACGCTGDERPLLDQLDQAA